MMAPMPCMICSPGAGQRRQHTHNVLRIADNLELPGGVGSVQVAVGNACQIAFTGLLRFRGRGRIDGEQVLARMLAEGGDVEPL